MITIDGSPRQVIHKAAEAFLAGFEDAKLEAYQKDIIMGAFYTGAQVGSIVIAQTKADPQEVARFCVWMMNGNGFPLLVPDWPGKPKDRIDYSLLKEEEGE